MTNVIAIDPLLDIKQAAAVLSQSLGRPYTENAVRRAADDARLPFFKDPLSGIRVIRKSRLLALWDAAETVEHEPRPRARGVGRPRK